MFLMGYMMKKIIKSLGSLKNKPKRVNRCARKNPVKNKRQKR